MPVRVLLIDKHTILREGVRHLLEASGQVEVVGEASDGWEAVRQAARLRPDVAVMEILMPRMNGIDACAHICEAEPTCRVVILSEFVSKDRILGALKAGALAYISKEATSNALLDAIQSAHDGKRFLGPGLAEHFVNETLDEVAGPKSVSPLDKLSRREREILQMVVEGESSATIGQIIHLSPKTVDTYRSRLMRKLGIRHLPGLVKFTIRHGLISLE